MARTKISEFSSTPANNTDIDSINIAEGCAPSNINDAIRELMAQLKDFQTGAVGDSFNGPIGTTTAAAGAFTTLSASSTVTLSGGTANGVTYLNGSKVLTSGSALTFDGTNLGIGKTPSGFTGGKLDVAGFGYFNYNATSQYVRVGAVSDSSADIYRNAGDLGYTVETGYNQRWYIGGSEGMRLTSTGLGIGTSSPSTKLYVLSSAATPTVIETSGGTAAYLQLKNTGGSAYIGSVSDALAFYTSGSGTERMRLDSAGNLGLGVTPSAWGGGYKSIDLQGGSFSSSNTTNAEMWSNGYYNGTSSIYKVTGGASLYSQGGGLHRWYNAPSGTAGNAITFTQAATLTAGGNYLVGDTSDYLASRIYAKTTTTDNSTNALSLRNSASTELFRVRSDGYIYAGFYPQTTASAANVTIASGGDLLRSTSALKYKQDIRDIEEMDIDLLRPVRYKSKCANDDQTKDHLGLIADEAAEAGFEELVIRGADGEVEGFQYERLTVVLLKTVQSLRQRVATLEAK